MTDDGEIHDHDMEELFAIPEEDRPEPEYPIIEWEGIKIRLMNTHHSLWGDKLWEAGKIMGNIILQKKFGVDLEGKSVVEFGAGSGIGSMSAAISKAKIVVSTDYPDDNLLDNLRFNCSQYPNIVVVGHQWGKDVSPILAMNGGKKFDFAILADLVFNHVCHEQLLSSLSQVLAPDGVAMVTYTSHRPHLIENDHHFFVLAEENYNFKVEELGTQKHPPMFENDFGSLEVRSTAHICRLTFKKQ